MLTWVPVISPIDVTIREPPATEPQAPLPTTPEPARIPGPPEPLDGPVKTVMYRDEDWWRDKLETARKRLRGETDPTEP